MCSLSFRQRLKYERSKIKNKHCDFIFANDVSKKNIGFNSDYNKVTMIDKKGNIKHFPKNNVKIN